MSSKGFADVPSVGRYVLRNARVPSVLLDEGIGAPVEPGLASVDLVIEAGLIAAVVPAGAPHEGPGCDLRAGMVLPGFVDMHTHLDKGHIWPRAANPDGTFMGAIQAVPVDRGARWSAVDVERRMEFALRCAYAHGTVAIRTHLDSLPPQHAISWPVFEQVRERWRGRIELQAVALIHADAALDPSVLPQLLPRIRAAGGLLGVAAASHPRMRDVIRVLVACAGENGFDLDLHLDETQDPGSDGLRCLAEEVLATGFAGRVTAGHCCALARQHPDEAAQTIARVAQAGISVVSLPMCNLYLQDRVSGATPRHRGVTLLRELAAGGVKTAIASDNTRDPFYAYGDLDPLEVLREGVRIGHLDHPVEAAVALVTRNPAEIIGMQGLGRIGVGRPADLVLLSGRTWSEVFARPGSDRTVLRRGLAIDRDLPDYRELDDLMAT